MECYPQGFLMSRGYCRKKWKGTAPLVRTRFYHLSVPLRICTSFAGPVDRSNTGVEHRPRMTRPRAYMYIDYWHIGMACAAQTKHFAESLVR